MSQIIKLVIAVSIAALFTACDEKSSSSTAGASATSAPEQAVAAVDSAALFNQGLDYRNGKNGVPQDSAKAFELFSKAAELGERDAMFFVGIMYENGESVAVDQQKALEWLTKSADAGNGSAPERLKALKAQMSKK